MAKYPTPKMKLMVAQRAEFRYEYCLTPEADSYYGFEVDHIISLRHSGQTTLDNLAFSCPDCNRNKGTDLGTILSVGGDLIPFSNPRTQLWSDHFEIYPTGLIGYKSHIGLATVQFFQFNHPDRIIERILLIRCGLLPLP